MKEPKYSATAFFSNVRISDDVECWLWQGRLGTGTGYGQFWTGEKQVGAHRWAYEFCVGAIPSGLDLDHLCRIRACVNPSHLEPVTRRENLLRGVGITATNAQKTHCVHGHEYTPDNTYRRPDTKTRQCRACAQVRMAAVKATKHDAKHYFKSKEEVKLQ
jgi:hypothetical protein